METNLFKCHVDRLSVMCQWAGWGTTGVFKDGRKFESCLGLLIFSCPFARHQATSHGKHNIREIARALEEKLGEHQKQTISTVYIEIPQSSQVLKFPKSEMLAGDCAKGTIVLCFLCRKHQKILGESRGMLPQK